MLYTKEQNLTAFKKLPSLVREFFMSEETISDLNEIARANSLAPKQKDKLMEITNNLMLGFTSPEECEKQLVESLGLMGERAENIKKYVRNKIVEKVKNLRTLSTDEEVSPEASSTPKAQSVSIENSKISKVISDISNKYQLTVEQAAGIEKEISSILSGEKILEDFRSNIVNLYRVTYDQALKIAYTVNDQIFSKATNSNITEPASVSKNIIENINQESPIEKPQKNQFLEKQTDGYISPDHMIPDHDEMERVDGPHLHSQNIMPEGMGTIVDRKLSGIFRNRAASSQPSQDITSKRNERYKSGDPYREPIE